MSDLDKQIEQLRKGQFLPEKIVYELCQKAKEIFIEEGNIQRVDPPVVIVGDIHGQFYDLSVKSRHID